jgi:PAS domain S-box-containing protein
MKRSTANWPSGHSLAGEAIRSEDWTDHLLGPVVNWPRSLRYALDFSLDLSQPIGLFWGEEHLFFCNDAWLNLTGDGKDHSDSLGRPAREVFAGTWPLLEPRLRQVFTTGKTVVFEDQPFFLYEFDGAGDASGCRYTLRPVRTEDGSVGGVHLMVDLPERTQSGQRLDLLLEASEIGSWEWDAISNTVTWSEKLEAIFGMNPGEFDGSFESYLNAIHPDDQKPLLSAIQQARDRNAAFRIEHRCAPRNGKVTWLECRGRVLRNEDGRATGMIGTCMNITKRKLAEERLRESEEHFRLALEVTCLGTWRFDPATGQVHLDQRMCFIWGDNRSVIPLEEVVDRVHPTDRASVQQAVADALDPASNGKYSLDFRILWDDGTVHWISANGQVQFYGEGEERRAMSFFGTALDITERKQAELRNHFLARLNDALLPIDDPDALMDTTARLLGEYLEVDRCAYGEVEEDGEHFIVTGDYTRGDMLSMVGRWSFSSFGEEGRRLLYNNQVRVVEDISRLEHLSPAERQAYERQRIVATLTVPLHKDGRLVAGLTLHRRASRRWQPDEIELVKTVANRCWEALMRARLTRDLQAMNENLEQRVEERTAALLAYQEQLRSLAAQLSEAEERERQRLATELHDNLGQLLTMCKMRLDLLRRRPLPQEASTDASDLTKLMDEAIRYTRDLMSDLKPPPSLDQEDVSEVMQWLAQKNKEKYGLDVTVEDDGRPKPLSDEIQSILIQATRELLFNVVKHAGVREAQVVLKRRENFVEVCVTDKGKGFDLLKAQPKSAKDGGFGLFSIRERMHWLGGRLVVDSTPGAGTTATLYVPIQKIAVGVLKASQSQRERVQNQPSRAPGTTEIGQKIRVLLADDHRMVRTGLRKIIEEEEDLLVVAEASNGKEAIRLAHETSPDVVVMDVNMPDLNGIEATRAITAELPRVRVIGLSLHDQENVTQAMRDAGATAYLSKAEVYETLCATIRSEAKAIMAGETTNKES